MIQVHFSGIADWFTKDKNGQSHPRVETVSYIEYDYRIRQLPSQIFSHNSR